MLFLSIAFLLVSVAIPMCIAIPYQNSTEDQNNTEAALSNDIYSCSNCDDERVKELQIELIKSTLLQKLGMTHPPKITRRPLPENPPIMEHLRQIPEKDDEEMLADEPIDYANTDNYEMTSSIERILVLATEPYHNIDSPNVVCFKLDLEGKDISVSHLWIYVDKARVVQRTVTHLRVYKVIPATSTSPMKSKLYKEKTISLSTASGGWQKFDAKQLTKEWMKDRRNTYQYIEIEARDSAGNNVVITDYNNKQRPLLAITLENRKPRVRQPPKRVCPEIGKKPCCRHPIIINFSEIGWDWVLAPRSFKTYYCNGDCSVSFSRFNRHTQLLILNKSPIPCCSARSYSDLKLLFFNDNSEVVYDVLDDIIVEDCSCV